MFPFLKKAILTCVCFETVGTASGAERARAAGDVKRVEDCS